MHLLYATDRQIDAYVVKALREAGHIVEPTNQPADGLAMASAGDYQAMILDWWARPAENAAHFAQAGPWAPVVVICAIADEAERIEIFKAGADACFIRPAPFIELAARLEALGRMIQRTRATASDRVAGEMIAAEQAVRLDGRNIALSAREFRVMSYLVAHAGEVISLDRLQQQIWGDVAEPRPDLVQACLSRLRRKLATAGARGRLRTVAGHGYVIDAR
jgi:two-component system OmpR family response regulator